MKGKTGEVRNRQVKSQNFLGSLENKKTGRQKCMKIGKKDIYTGKQVCGKT